MESKYTKYTIIEIVPVELKSYKTPLYTIINSILLWFWLIIYYFYINIKLLLTSLTDWISLHKTKYTTTTKHNEIIRTIKNDEDLESKHLEKIDEYIMNNENFVSEVQVFKGKIAFNILKELLISDEVVFDNIDGNFAKEVGSIVLRKEKITFTSSEKTNHLSGKTILVRSFSKPVEMFLNFMLKKIF